MKVDWHSFDYDSKKDTPEPNEPVWVMEGEQGVTLGYFDGYTFRMWYGSDDCAVDHWAAIVYPDPPE